MSYSIFVAYLPAHTIAQSIYCIKGELKITRTSAAYIFSYAYNCVYNMCVCKCMHLYHLTRDNALIHNISCNCRTVSGAKRMYGTLMQRLNACILGISTTRFIQLMLFPALFCLHLCTSASHFAANVALNHIGVYACSNDSNNMSYRYYIFSL